MTAIIAPHNLNETVKLPWALTGAALIAFASHFITTEYFLGLPLLGLALVLNHFIEWRLPESRTFTIGLRLVVFSMILMVFGLPDARLQGWYLQPEYTNPLGAILATELVVRAWERHEPQHRSEFLGTELFLSGLILMASSNVYDVMYIQLLTPPYLLLLIMALRSFKPARSPRASLRGMRIFAAIAAVVLGVVVIRTALRYDNQIQMLFIDWVRQRRPQIGLTATPRLEAVFNPQASMQRVLVIDGPRAERHLRTLAFDRLSSKQWFPSLNERRRDVFTETGQPAGPRDATLRFEVFGDTHDSLPLPLNTIGLATAEPLVQDQLGTLRFEDNASSRQYEAVVSTDEHRQGLVALAPDEAGRERALSMPDVIDARVMKLAREVAGEGLPLVRTMRIAQHLQASHAYSLTFYPENLEDPLSEFILERKAAHCEYFASAMVIMARAAGVPARLITGYYAHEPAGSDRMVVRDRDAHAWAECWIDEIGWVTMDATPAGGRPDVLFPEPSRLRKAWEWITDLPSVIAGWLGLLSKRALIATISGIAVLVLVIGVVQMMRRRGDAGDPLAYASPDAALAIIAQRYEAWQRRRGVPCRENTTWREHARTMKLPQACIAFIDAYQAARFGITDPQQLQRVDQLMAEVERTAESKPTTGQEAHG